MNDREKRSFTRDGRGGTQKVIQVSMCVKNIYWQVLLLKITRVLSRLLSARDRNNKKRSSIYKKNAKENRIERESAREHGTNRPVL